MNFGENSRTFDRGSRRKSWYALTALCLSLILTACASDPEIVTRTEYRDREVPVRVKVPAGLLVDCQVSPMPIPGDTWQDVWVVMVEKDKEQSTCNDRFDQIREWQDGQDEGNGTDENE